MTNAGGPLSMSFPLLPARPSRVRPGGAVNPAARGVVLTDLPADLTAVLVGSVPVTPDADGFVPIPTSGATLVEIKALTSSAGFYARLLESKPRVVSYNELSIYDAPGQNVLTERPSRLELVGLPVDARVEVGFDDVGREVLGVASESPTSRVQARWNADRTIRTVFVPLPNGIARSVVVSLPDADYPGGYRSVYRSSILFSSPGELRDVVLTYLRPGIREELTDFLQDVFGTKPPATPSPTSPAPGSVPGTTPGITPSIGSALLALSVQPSNAVVLVNGNALRDTTRPITLSPGSYRLDVSAPGYEKHAETFVAAPGRTVRLAVRLVATPTKRGWTRGRIALAAVGGAVALGGLGAVVVYLVRRPDEPAPAPSLPAGSSAQALPAAGRSNPRRAAARQGLEPDDDQRPSQEDLDESIHIAERANLRFTRTRMVGGEPTEQFYTTDGVVAYYLRREIARASSRAGLFKKLNELEMSLGSPAIVSVNDHGNVTTYSYTGKVLGEWV